MQTFADWQRRNLAQLRARLAWLAGAPEGVLLDRRSAHQRLLVIKRGGQVQLYCAGADDLGPEPDTSGVMSRVDPREPLLLLGTYTQAMMLALAWKPEPARVGVLGFGGGRLATVLHHHIPDVVVQGVELDAEVLAVAARFFGVRQDERLRVTEGDARAFLAAVPEKRYDILMADCFVGSGEHPEHLANREFYDLCRRRLVADGVLVANLVSDDPRLARTIRAVQAVFPRVHLFARAGSRVLFATAGPARDAATIRAGAERVQARACFLSLFVELTGSIAPLALTD